MKRILENENLIFPDYKNSILNVAALFANVYNVNTGVSPTKLLDYNLIADKKNIIFIILDGFGYNLIERIYKNDLPFFRENLSGKLTSVFPPTTAAAITSIYSAKLPAEHGVLGWALYFKEYFRIFDYLPVKDSSLGKEVSDKIFDYFKILKPDSMIRKIAQKNPDMNISYVTPKKLKGTPYNKIISSGSDVRGYLSEKGMFKKILKSIAKNKKNFILAYSTNPDSLEHHYGTASKEVRKKLITINNELEKFYKKLPKDTAVIISADHGLTDVDEFYIVNNDKELYDSLILPLFPESRFVSFFVKPHKIDFFKHAFSKYENDFILLDRDEFISFGFLGDSEYHFKLDDFIGNFVAIAIGKKGFRQIYRARKEKNMIFKAHHSGLTKDEMEIPLFYFEK